MTLVEILLVVTAAVYLLYKWVTKKYNTFEERGMPHDKPIPVAGNFGRVMLNKESFAATVRKLYIKYKDQKIFGMYNFLEPVFVVKDPELIKKITVRDFDHFPNHQPFFNFNGDPLLEGMLSIMKDQRWKDMRNTLTPVFTAAKMRQMFSLMNESFDESLKYLKETSKGENGVELELKQCFTKLSNDIIASTAFGLKVNSFDEPNNEFYSIGQSITNFRGSQILKLIFTNIAPKLMDLLGLKIFDTKKIDYFMRLVVDAMKYRTENKIVRPDMIQLLMEAKEESSHSWSDTELVAQCFIFFFAAFENNANFICAACHELMDNSEVQQRLYDEAVELRTSLKGNTLSYDNVQQMKYMDMVLSEVLRKWGLAAFTDRVCSKDYKLNDEDDELVFEFKVGDRIWFPLAAMQWDEEYFENPEVFDPERFSDENKDSIRPFTYLPFGVGPRVCIGNRYALMQAKAMIYHLVLNFKMERSPKTPTNILESARGFQITPQNGFWMRFIQRN